MKAMRGGFAVPVSLYEAPTKRFIMRRPQSRRNRTDGPSKSGLVPDAQETRDVSLICHLAHRQVGIDRGSSVLAHSWRSTGIGSVRAELPPSPGVPGPSGKFPRVWVRSRGLRSARRRFSGPRTLSMVWVRSRENGPAANLGAPPEPIGFVRAGPRPTIAFVRRKVNLNRLLRRTDVGVDWVRLRVFPLGPSTPAPHDEDGSGLGLIARFFACNLPRAVDQTPGRSRADWLRSRAFSCITRPLVGRSTRGGGLGWFARSFDARFESLQPSC